MPVTKTSDNAGAVQEGVRRLLKLSVVVGIPDINADRSPSPGDKNQISNAAIGYAMEFGLPDKNVPARPFLVPGLRSVMKEMAECLKKAGEDAFDRDFSEVERRFEQAGLIGADAVRRQITDGSFAPLSERTIQARADRGRKGAKQYLKLRAEGTPDDVLQGAGLLKPLIDSGQLRRAITSVVRSK